MPETKTRQQRRATERKQAKAKPTNGKVPIGLRDVLCDEMPVIIGTEIYYPHEGEVIRTLPVTTQETIVEAFDLMARNLGDDSAVMDALRNAREDVMEAKASLRQMGEDRRALWGTLANLIEEWTLTDFIRGTPLDPPHGNPDAFKALTEVELQWLANAVMLSLNNPGLEPLNPSEVALAQAERGKD